MVRLGLRIVRTELWIVKAGVDRGVGVKVGDVVVRGKKKRMEG